MMNDAMMQMKSRHNDTNRHLTGFARRAFMLLTLLVVGLNRVSGQVTIVGSGVLDESHVGEYATMKSSYPVDASSLVPGVTTWSGSMASEATNHWSGNTVAYANTGNFTNSEVYKETTLNLPKGDYVILAAGRGSSNGDVTIFMSVANSEVTMGSRGPSVKGVNTVGEASFSEGTFANNGYGHGWQYFYVKFSVTADASVSVRVGGRTTANDKWVSISTPILWKTIDDNVTNLKPHATAVTKEDADFPNETTATGVYRVVGYALHEFGLNDCQYIRFLLVDEVSNTQVAIPNLSTSSSASFHNYGSLGRAAVGVDFLNGNYFDVTLPQTRGQYSLYCYMSSSPGTQIVENRTIKDVEPEINKTFKFIITYPYSGSLLSHATPQKIEVPVEAQNRYSKTVTELSDDYNAIVTGLSTEGTMLTTDMLKEANGYGATSTQGNTATNCAYVLNNSTGQPYGDAGVINYADLSAYAKLVVTVTEGTPRFLFNRDVADGQWNEDESQSHLIDNTRGGWSAKYFTQEGNVYTVNLQKMMADKGYVHLHAIKSTGGNVTVESMVLYGTPLTTADMHRYNSWTNSNDGISSTGTYNYILGRSTDQPYGDPAVNAYVDLSAYKKLVVTMSSGTPRFMFNRDVDEGQWNEDESLSHLIEYPKDGWVNRFFTKEGNTYIVDLEKMVAEKGYAHLHAIKGANWQNVTAERMELYGNPPSGNVYARLFVANKNTGEMTDQNALTISTPSGWSQKSVDTNYGYVYYGDAANLKTALNGITVSSSTPLYDGSNTLSLVISSDFTRMLPANASSASSISVEPNWEKQYLLDFYKVDDFVGSLKSNGQEVRGGVMLDNANVTSRALTELAAARADIVSKLSNPTGKVYARLFVADDAGNAIDNQNLLTYSGLSSDWTWNDTYGWIYYGDGLAENLLQGITVSSSSPLSSTGALVGLVVSSDMSRLNPNSPTSVSDIMEEPNWEVLALHHFTYPFAGTVKSNYFRHSKEVLLTSSEVSAGVTQIPLNEALSKIKSEYVKTNETLAQNFHIRWFVTYKGEMIANSEDYLAPVTSGTEHKTKDGYGIYWNSATCPTYPLSAGSESTSSQTINWLNMNFTKPDYGHWSDYKVVVWLSDDTSASNGQTTSTDGSGTILTHEPDINMVYYYSFFVEEDFRFVHSKGAAIEAYPDLPYLIKSSSVQQYDWDNTTSTQVPANGDIRQDVHTVIYDVYLDPNGGLQPLQLPFENYFTTGNDLEPTAYIRWYDWETDLGSDKLTIVGTWLENLRDFDTGNSRGFFALNRDLTKKKPTHNMVGVTYNPSGLTSEHVIACDVSKYYDGTYRGSNPDTRPDFSGLYHPYMLHEPTLSIRYLFRIQPAKDIVKKINDGKSDFDTHMATIKSTADGANYRNLTVDQKRDMFELCEDNGLVAVSYKDGNSQFALRANLASLDQYYVGTESNPIQCDKIYWFSYYEDADGLLYEKQLNWGSDNRINLFTINDLNGDYHVVSSGWTEKAITLKAGMKFHVVGRIGTSTDNYQPVVHYELQFNNAPALLVDNLSALESDAQIGKDVLHRRKAYLDSHYNYAGRVSFDEFFSTNTLNNQNENHTEKPLPWPEAQYAYCYPQIDQYRIATGVSGLTPIHGDYILLKSAGGTYSHHMDNSQPYQYFFYRDAWGAGQTEMHDFTRMYGDGTYGGFLYVDASNEARTIASLDFNAKLCSGSQIFFTAAISDITTGENGSIAPQLMIHVYGVDGSGNKTEKPIVSFLSGSLRSVAYGSSFQYCKWYQLYGQATIPSSIDVSGYTTFAADIDNYSEHTNGADFCVDEIRFYTSTGKVNVKMEGGACVDEDMTFTANIDVEHLENKMTLTGTSSNPQHIYYRIYEKTGQDDSGAIQYKPYSDNSIYNNSGKSYGDVSIRKYVLNNDGSLAVGDTNNNGYELIDGVLYFDLLKNETLNLEQGKEYFMALTADMNDPKPDNEETGWANPNNACDVYSNFFIPKKKYVHFLTIEDNTVVSQIIEGVCGQPTLAHKEYIIETQYPDDNEPTGFKTLPYGTGRNLASVTGDSNPISTEAGEARDQNGVLFDFFVGTEAELTGKYKIGETTYNTSVLEALQHYRNFERVYPQQHSEYSINLATDYEGGNADNYTILQDAISKGKLLLAASGQFKYDIYETQTFLALPVKKNYEFDGTSYILCNYIPFTFTVNGGFNVPDLTLGFDDVDYSTAGRERVIRVGLEQLNKMKNKGYLLHVPVNMYLDKHRQSFKKLYFPQDSYLTISAVDRDADPLVPNTTDPQLLNDASNAIGKKFAKIVPTISGDLRPAVDKTHMYLALDLSECEIDFHEGYQYEVATNFFDEDDEALNGNPDARACIGDLFLMIKVVPEFVTWHSQFVDNDGKTTTTNTGYKSANWYNDDNWKRSVRADLYKDASGNNAKQNTPTEGHPEGYDDNGEGSLDGLTTGSNPGFVPMKFTYVTLPSGEPAPSLINEPRVTGVGVGDRRQGGGFLDLTKTTLLTDRSPRDPDGTPDNQRTSSMPTENIYYDLLVRYSYDSDNDDSNDPDTTDPFGEGCFGHRQLRNILVSTDPLTVEQAAAYNEAMSPATPKVTGDVLTSDEAHAYNWYNQGIENRGLKVFDCEKYQGNVCHDIYFKSGAELLRQQRLTYKRAWVEKELYANRWYLLASPLQSTYAGDMYVPYSNGRQETEAFQEINFNDKIGGNKLYSRTKYPIYQRSWGANNGTVYVKQNDIRANSYSANLNFSTVTTNFIEWGHTFNDVQVPYHTSDNALADNLAGFSIRAHKKDQTDKVQIRLPKADTTYDYFEWNDVADPAADTGIKTVSKPNFDYKIDDDTGTNTMVTLFTVPTSNRLVTDEHQHDGDLRYSVDAMQQNGDYLLVGNPYMVSIDMNRFFAYTYDNDHSWKQDLEHTETDVDADNVDLEYCYYTYEVTEENGVVTSELKTCPVTVRYNRTDNKYVPLELNNKIVRPMQGFFVKKGTATDIIFNRYMQVDGNFPPEEWNLNTGNNGARSFALTLTANNGRGRSTASVALSDRASSNFAGGEDVETLFDSNFADVPMVYTVSADGMAVSINQLPKLEMVPFGVTCNSNELIDVNIDSSQLTSDLSLLYVFDALYGTTTAVKEGESVSIQPNDYGRYYLTTKANESQKVNGNAADAIVISVRNGLVTVTSNSQIAHVRAVSVSGVTAYEQTDCGTNTQFRLQQGTYVVEAEGEAGKQTTKILVR